jgi:transcriptional regulator with XRE-family HTH domain
MLPCVEKPAAHLANVLRQLREDAGLTLREVEERSGRRVSNGYLSQLETGLRPTPNPRVLTTLAQVYGVPVATLFEAAGYVDPPEASALERAWTQVLADPQYKFGTRMKGDLDDGAKRLFIQLYEQATGKKLLGDEDLKRR